MAKISNIISNAANRAVDFALVKPLNKLSTAPGMAKVRKEYCNKNMNFINGIGIASIVLKDGLGCYMYVNQSLHNEKIPDDKRKFVATLDLANGGLMILMQILMHLTISNKLMQSKMFNKLYGKYFNRSVTKGYQAILKNHDKYKAMTNKEFTDAMGVIRGKAVEAFSNITSLAAATIIGKRVIVPFIATPLADKTKAWMCRNDKPAEINSETKNTYCCEKHRPKNEENKKQPTISGTISDLSNQFKQITKL